MQTEESDSSPLKYKRVLLKLSGEALMGPGQFGIDIPTCEKFAHAIKQAQDTGAEVCLVIGGGNIFAASRARPRAWSVHRPIPWACWPPS